MDDVGCSTDRVITLSAPTSARQSKSASCSYVPVGHPSGAAVTDNGVVLVVDQSSTSILQFASQVSPFVTPLPATRGITLPCISAHVCDVCVCALLTCSVGPSMQRVHIQWRIRCHWLSHRQRPRHILLVSLWNRHFVERKHCSCLGSA